MLKILLLSYFLFGMIFDLKFRKIPNLMLFSGMFIGIIYNIHKQTLFPQFILNCVLVIVFFGHGFYFAYIGGGDIKLLLFAGCWLENSNMLVFVIITILSGAVVSVLCRIEYRNLNKILLFDSLYSVWGTDIINRIKTNKGLRIPYTICIFIAALISLFIS